MTTEGHPWLPRGAALGKDGTLGRLLEDGGWYQISLIGRGPARVLIVPEETASAWVAAGLLPESAAHTVIHGDKTYRAISGGSGLLGAIEGPTRPATRDEALSFAHALKRTREALPGPHPVSEGIFVERYSAIYPPPTIADDLPDDVILGRFLTGGVEVSCRSLRRVQALRPDLAPQELDKMIRAAGIGEKAGEARAQQESKEPKRPGSFALPGRPELQQFFFDNVVDIVENADRYKAMGIEFPAGIVLHGPPGCGKTFAVSALVQYLEWPNYAIDSASIGSKYIHETSRKIAEVFDHAVESAPSVVVIDEMESFLAERAGGGEHRLEEVAEFLRRIQAAPASRVLVIGMTNRLDLIDPAILRRGRFDHVVEVQPATQAEVHALLQTLFATRKHADIDLQDAANRLAGRPLSDVAFFVREAARLAARAGHESIDPASAARALDTTVQRAAPGVRRSIGFL